MRHDNPTARTWSHAPANTPARHDGGLALAVIVVLSLLLAACGGGATDTNAPSIHITSPASSSAASYTLAGNVFDAVGVTGATWSLNGGVAQPLAVSGETFSAALTLVAGNNDIVVTASDAAGNTGTRSHAVDYQAAPAGAAGPDIAARGDTIVITGSNFGATGAVDIGGVPAPTSSWSDGQIELTLPQDAPGGPQQVNVHGPYGTSTFELFVGVHYAVGELDGLIALDLPRGTAVRLEAGTYGTAVSMVYDLDNLSLYGQGADETILDFSLPSGLQLHVNHGFEVIVSDLRIETDLLLFGPAPLTGGLSVLSLDATTLSDQIAALELPADETAVATYFQNVAEHVPASGDLQAQNLMPASLTFRNVALHEVAGGSLYVSQSLFSGDPFGGEMNLVGTEIVAPNTPAILAAGGRFSMLESSLELGNVSLGSATSRLEIELSLITIPAAGGTLVGSTGLGFRDSQFHAETGFAIWGAFPMLAQDSSGPSALTGNTFSGSGIEMIIAYAPALIEGNEFLLRNGVAFIAENASIELLDNDFALGVPAVPTPLLVLINDGSHGHLGFHRNRVDFTNAGAFTLLGNHTFELTNNLIEGDGGTGTALTAYQADSFFPLDITVTNNVFRDFENALGLEGAGAAAQPFTAVINHNEFDFLIDSAPKVAEISGMLVGDLDGRHNVWGDNTDVSVVETYITLNAPSTVTLVVDPITQP